MKKNSTHFLNIYKIANATNDIKTAYKLIGVLSRKSLIVSKSKRETLLKPKTLLN